MYVYDAFDRTLVTERVAEFRDQVARRLSGELTEEEFKPLRLMNGVYLQLHAYMLRIAIPYGTLSSRQLRMLAHIARRYDRGYGHFTTRTNIQYHWIKLEDLPAAMADLASVGMHGMQTSGNNVRNITTDQWAGVAPDEIEDPRVWAEVIRQHVTLHPEFSFMPRKFKICVGTSSHDRAALRIHDLALHMHRNNAGELGFEVMVGGGLGRTPYLAKTIKPFLHKRDLPAVWRVLDEIGVAQGNVGLVSDIISCPGLDYCSLANARSIPIAQEITRRFHNIDLQRDLGRLHINISGCINACGHHHVGHIGILGVEKNGEEFYQITLGGKADEGAKLGTLIGPAVPYAQVADVVEDIAAAYLELRERPDELFIDTVNRLGVEPFKERVYATR
jgi:sulfite reductase beta subunit-like hemoprotein